MKRIRPRLPDAQECAVLLLVLLELRNQEAPTVTRVRLSILTLQRLWGREKITQELLEETQEWLSRGGWTLFYARTTYAAIRTTAVHGWARLSSKRMAEELEQVRVGNFDFDRHSHLFENGTSFDE